MVLIRKNISLLGDIFFAVLNILDELLTIVPNLIILEIYIRISGNFDF